LRHLSWVLKRKASYVRVHGVPDVRRPLVNARREGSADDQFASAIGLHNLDIVDAPCRVRGRGGSIPVPSSNYDNPDNNEQQYDFNRCDQLTYKYDSNQYHNNDYTSSCTVGSAHSHAHLCGQRGLDRRHRSRVGCHAEAQGGHAGYACGLSPMPDADRPLRDYLSQLSHPPLSRLQILSTSTVAS